MLHPGKMYIMHAPISGNMIKMGESNECVYFHASVSSGIYVQGFSAPPFIDYIITVAYLEGCRWVLSTHQFLDMGAEHPSILSKISLDVGTFKKEILLIRTHYF